MKRILVILFAVLLLSSCGKPAQKPSDYISPEKLPQATHSLSDVAISVSAFKNILFVQYPDRVERMDITSNSCETVLEAEGIVAVSCDGARLAVLKSQLLEIYDHDGSLIKSIPITGIDSPLFEKASKLFISGEAVVMSFSLDKSDSVYYVDTASGDIAMCDGILPSHDVRLINATLSDDGNILAMFGAHRSFAGGSYSAVEFDVSQMKAVSITETDSPGVIGLDGNVYTLQNQLSPEAFLSIIAEYPNGEKENVMYMSRESLNDHGIDIVGGKLIYADGENFMLYWESECKVMSTSISDRSLVILAPEGTNLESLALEFQMKTGASVRIRTYNDSYSQVIRTKIMAQDDDFDLFVTNDVALLDVILQKDAFYPLDSFEGVVYNFDNILADGVREFMTDDAGLFGVPMKVYYWGAQSLVSDSIAELSANPTVAELLELGNSLAGSGKKLFVDRFVPARMVMNYIDDMLYKEGEVNTQELEELFAELKRLNDMGTLCDGDAHSLLTYGSTGFSALDIMSYNGESSFRIAPTRDGRVYLEPAQAVLMNKHSQNKDLAAEFIKLITSGEVLYSHNNLGVLLGNDIKKNPSYSSFTESQKELLEFSVSLYANARPSKADGIDGLVQFIAQSISELFDENMTAHEVAEEITRKVEYVYFE